MDGMVEELPAGWDARLDTRSNRVFFVDHNSQTTTWNHPITHKPIQLTPDQANFLMQQAQSYNQHRHQHGGRHNQALSPKVPQRKAMHVEITDPRLRAVATETHKLEQAAKGLVRDVQAGVHHKDHEGTVKRYREIEELATRQLLNLDAFDVKGDPNLRQQRKQDIQGVHQVHNQLDSVKKQIFGL